MVAPDAYEKVAKEIVAEMGHQGVAFLTKTRTEITTMIRKATGQPRTKIGRSSAEAVEAAIDRLGFKMFPSLSLVGANEAVRVYRRGTVADRILQGILHPGATTDIELATTICNVKGVPQILKFRGDA
jgi:hypothetical protein